MKTNRLRAFSVASTSFLLIAGSALAQGDLLPTGAPAPIFRTLLQVEPRIPIDADHTPGDANSVYRISAPGSYYLVGNLTVSTRVATAAVKQSGIEVSASNVTIDLNGFRITGANNTNALHGINAAAGLRDLSVRNGSVSDFNQDGIHAGGVSNSSYEGLSLDGNTGSGLVAGDQCMVRNCRATGNGNIGISVNSFSTVVDCQARSNPKAGISAISYSVISRCTAGDASSGDAIVAESFCTVDHCTANNGFQWGIRTLQRPVISDCVVSSSGHIDVNGVSGGILLHFAGQVKNCSISFNRVGIEILGSSDGGGATVVDNSIESNTGGGIDALSGANKIDGNFLGFNGGPPIRTHTPGNFIVRNHAVGNGSNYTLGGNDTVGPIVVGSGTISGLAGGSSPWANFRQ